MLPVMVEPEEYQSAAAAMVTANSLVIDSLTELSGQLGGSGGMAGIDAGGAGWAAKYDVAATSSLAAGIALGNDLGDTATLLAATGTNHARADQASTAGGGHPGPPTGPSLGTESLSAPAPPSANGGSSDPPHGWFLIATFLQYAWPTGDTGRLRAAGSAWQSSSTTLSEAVSPVANARALVNAQTSPEVDQVTAALTDTGKDLNDLSVAFASLSRACEDFATAIDDAHKQVRDEVASLLEWSIAFEVGGAILSEIGGEFAAQALVAERCEATAVRVDVLLEEVEAAATSLGTTLATVETSSVAVSARIAALLSPGVRQALVRVVEALDTAERTAEAAAIAQAARERAAQVQDATDRAAYASYVVRQNDTGKPVRSYGAWLALKNTVAANRAKGEALERQWMARDAARGGPPLTPQTSVQTPAGLRKYDYGNAADEVGYEVKSGKSPTGETLRQLNKDAYALSQGWTITWHLTVRLTATVMARLRELAADYPGRFSFDPPF